MNGGLLRVWVWCALGLAVPSALAAPDAGAPPADAAGPAAAPEPTPTPEPTPAPEPTPTPEPAPAPGPPGYPAPEPSPLPPPEPATDGGPPEVAPRLVVDDAPNALVVPAAAPASAPPPPPPAVSLDGLDPAALEAQVGHLKALLAGQLSLDVPLTTLFAVDLLDVEAVAQRVQVLRERLDALRLRRDWLQDRAARAAQRVLPAEVPPRTPTAPVEPLDPAVPDEAVAPPGPTPPGPTPPGPTPPGPTDAPLTADEQAERAIIDLLMNRDALRLEVLSRSLEARRALVEAEQRRHRLAADERAAALAQAAAEAEARRAAAALASARAEAAAARSDAARLLAEGRMSVEVVRGDLAERRSAFATARLAFAREGGARLELAQRAHELLQSRVDADTADATYDAVVAALVPGRAAFATALDALDGPLDLPRHDLGFDPSEVRFRALVVEREALDHTIEAFNDDRAALAGEVRAQRLHEAEALAHDLRQLNDARIGLLPHLSRAKRERVLGLGREGLAQLAREFEQLRLDARWYLRSRPQRLARLPLDLLEMLGQSSKRWAALRLLALLLLGAAFMLRGRRWRAALDTAVERATAHRPARAAFRRAWPHLAALVPAAAYLGWIYALFGAVLGLFPLAELALLRTVFIDLALYRLFIAVAHRLLLGLASSPLAPVDAPTSARLLRSVRIIGRYFLVVQIFFLLAAAALGRGYLYTLVEEFAWVGAFPIAFWLLRHWRPDVERAYARRLPEGGLKGLLARGAGRLWGLALVPPALGHLTLSVVVDHLARLVMRFGRTRRALAYLFRRRLERAAGDRVVPEDGPGLDAATQVHLLDERPETSALVPWFPGLERTLSDLAQWRAGRTQPAVALVGERGVGKSTWLATLATRLPAPPVRAIFPASPRSTAEAIGLMARALELPEADRIVELEALIAAVLAGPRRVVLLDDAHHLIQRAPGGAATLDAFATLIRRTTGHLFWICAFGLFMWNYLRFLLRNQDLFPVVHRLDGWSEDDLARLIDRRTAAAGVEADYGDLLLDGAERLDRESQLARTRERYLRLLWDHVDGLPAMALYFWSVSLVAAGPGRVRVRLFTQPSADDLEGLGEAARFVLNAVVLHDGLDLHEAPQVLQLSPDRCRTALEHLRVVGCLERDPAGLRYRVPARWYPPVVRFLRRKHLLHV